jgi:hypothetical protein
MLDSMSRLKVASIARAAILLLGIAGLAWALILPAFKCSYPFPDYGTCSPYSAPQWEVAIVGVILVTMALASYLVARRRRASL